MIKKMDDKCVKSNKSGYPVSHGVYDGKEESQIKTKQEGRQTGSRPAGEQR